MQLKAHWLQFEQQGRRTVDQCHLALQKNFINKTLTHVYKVHETYFILKLQTQLPVDTTTTSTVLFFRHFSKAFFLTSLSHIYVFLFFN